jgi:hypothetical protein
MAEDELPGDTGLCRTFVSGVVKLQTMGKIPGLPDIVGTVAGTAKNVTEEAHRKGSDKAKGHQRLFVRCPETS